MEESDLMESAESLPLPKDWQRGVKSAVVQVVGMAHLALTQVRAKMTDDYLARSKLAAENERLTAEVTLLRREMELLRSRLERVPPTARTTCPPSGSRFSS
jgi:cell division protein FtsB